MVNFRERNISICGKDLKIKDTKMIDLETALKPVEQIEMESLEKQDEVADLNQELKELHAEANDIAMQRDDKRNLSRSRLNKIDLVNGDICKAEKLQEDSDKLKIEYDKIIKQAKKKEKEIKQKLKEYKDYSKETLPKIRLAQGKACEALLEGITADEFVKEYRLVDKVVVENLAPIIEMHMRNISQDKIEQKIKELTMDQYSPSFQ